MSFFKEISLTAAVAVVSIGVTLAASSTAEARYRRDGRVGYQSGTVIVSPWAAGATRSYYYGYRHGWFWDYAPAGPFVDYPYQNCGGGVCWY